MVRKTERYNRYRQKPPSEFKESTFKTVPISHTNYKGKKYNIKGAKAIVGQLKKSGEWAVQSYLVPRKKK